MVALCNTQTEGEGGRKREADTDTSAANTVIARGDGPAPDAEVSVKRQPTCWRSLWESAVDRGSAAEVDYT